MRAESKLPPIEYKEEIDVLIIISEQGRKYKLVLFLEGYELRSDLDMTSQDLLELNSQLQERIYSIARNNDQEPPSGNELLALAEDGYYAFKRVFGSSDLNDAIRHIRNLDSRLKIQVASENFFIPWELIYPIPLSGNEPDFKHFWGMNHHISRVNTKFNSGFIPPKISINDSPNLGILAYRSLDGVARGDLNFFQKLFDGGEITLSLLRSLDPQNRKTEFEEFRRFWEQNFDLAHFACHAVCDSNSPNQSHILLSNDFAITLMDMDVYDMAISGHPLITINACGTGILNPLHTSNFATAFLKYGARGVVATECAVPDMFAADFAEQFYIRLLEGTPLGESILTTRKYFLEKYNNPSGLLYSIYAPLSIRLVKKRDS